MSLGNFNLIAFKINNTAFVVAVAGRARFADKNDDLIVVPPIELPSWSETLLGSRTWDKLTLLLGGDLKNYDSNNRNLIFARINGLKRIVTR